MRNILAAAIAAILVVGCGMPQLDSSTFECSAGTHVDASSGQCVADSATTTADGGTTCAAGQHLGSSGQCVANTTTTDNGATVVNVDVGSRWNGSELCMSYELVYDAAYAGTSWSDCGHSAGEKATVANGTLSVTLTAAKALDGVRLEVNLPDGSYIAGGYCSTARIDASISVVYGSKTYATPMPFSLTWPGCNGTCYSASAYINISGKTPPNICG